MNHVADTLAVRPDCATANMSAGGQPLRVASWNIHSGRGQDRLRRPERTVQVLRELDADVYGIQEVDWQPLPGSPGVSEAEYFMDLAGCHAIAGPNVRDHRGHYGNVLLTRLPVLWHRTHDLAVPGREPRGAIEAILDAHGRPLRVIVTHLGLSGRERRRQARRLAAIVAQRPRLPTVLLGDLNAWYPNDTTLDALMAHFDAQSTTRPRSFPAWRPIFRLDRILRRGFRDGTPTATHVTSLARRASDHLPVCATLEA